MLRWDDLFKGGSVIDLDIKRWTARAKILPRDLGIQDSSEIRQALSLGCHRLVPRQAFAAISSAIQMAQTAVAAHSVPFAMIRGARFIPDGRKEECLADLAKAKAKFEVACDAFEAAYAEVKATQLPILKEALTQAARSPEAAEAAFNRLCAEYPSSVRDKFNLSWNRYVISSAKDQAMGDAVAEEAANVKSVIGDVIGQLRTQLGERVQELMDLVQKNGSVNKKSINSTLRLLERLEQLNFSQDRGLQAQITQVRLWLEGAEKSAASSENSVSLVQVKEDLTKGVEEAVAEAEAELSGLGRRRLGVVTTPAPAAASEGLDVFRGSGDDSGPMLAAGGM